MRPMLDPHIVVDAWSGEKANAFLEWRKHNQHADSMPVRYALSSQRVVEEFERDWAVQRLIGKKKP